MTDRERAMAEARKLALDAHCSYCDRIDPQGRSTVSRVIDDCEQDVNTDTVAIADALLEAEARGWKGAAAFYDACPVTEEARDETREHCLLIAIALRAQKGRPA